MKKLTEIVGNYEMLVDSFGTNTLIEIDDNDYQGDSYYLLRDNDKYGILIFGWGSCSGCDALSEIFDTRNKTEALRLLNELRDEMYDSIAWRSREEMMTYISEKDFGLEWYNYNDGGRKFVKELKNYSF